MASFIQQTDQDGNKIGWQARVRRKGYPLKTKVFRTKAAAQEWAASLETEMARGVWQDRSEAEKTTLKDLVERYTGEVTKDKRGAAQEISHTRAILEHPISSRLVASIYSQDIAKYRDDRRKVVSGSTVNRELNILSHVFTVAIQEWGFVIQSNPVMNCRRPKVDDRRDRRLVGDEETRLTEWAEKAEQEDGSMPIAHIIRFALETGMRRGEIAGMQWAHADLKSRVLLVPETKTGDPRRVPLSSRALAVLSALPRHLDGNVWGQVHAASISRAFARACRRAAIDDLRFHDLRHEATSRLFEKGLNPMQVSAVTGHKTLQMLKRYTHLKAEDLAKMLG